MVPAHVYSTFSSWEAIGTVKWCQTHREQAQTGFEPVLEEECVPESSSVELSTGATLVFPLSTVFLVLFFMLSTSFSLYLPLMSIFKCCLISLRLQPHLLLPGISSFVGLHYSLGAFVQRAGGRPDSELRFVGSLLDHLLNSEVVWVPCAYLFRILSAFSPSP